MLMLLLLHVLVVLVAVARRVPLLTLLWLVLPAVQASVALHLAAMRVAGSRRGGTLRQLPRSAQQPSRGHRNTHSGELAATETDKDESTL